MTITDTTTGSTIVQALETIYASVQDRHPELPNVVFITGTGLMGRGAKWGHHWKDAWAEASRYNWTATTWEDFEKPSSGERLTEIFIAGERLECGAADTLETILHEAAHALANVRGIKDTSRDNRYHNKRFLALAEELGLCYAGTEPHPTIGWSTTALTPTTRKEYAQELLALEDALVANMDTFRRLGLTTGGAAGSGGAAGLKRPTAPKAPSRSNLKATCACGTIIRASAKVLASRTVICEDCGEAFTEA